MNIEKFTLQYVFPGFQASHLLIVIPGSQRDVQTLKHYVAGKALFAVLIPGQRGEELLIIPVELEVVTGRAVYLVTVPIQIYWGFAGCLDIYRLLLVLRAHLQGKIFKFLETFLIK